MYFIDGNNYLTILFYHTLATYEKRYDENDNSRQEDFRVNLCDADLCPRQREQDGLKHHPEDLESCSHRVL